MDERREGDERPVERQVSLTFRPAHDQPFRWLPRHGAPLCIGEWAMQAVVRCVAYAPIYTAIVATLTLIVFLLSL